MVAIEHHHPIQPEISKLNTQLQAWFHDNLCESSGDMNHLKEGHKICICSTLGSKLILW